MKIRIRVHMYGGITVYRDDESGVGSSFPTFNTIERWGLHGIKPGDVVDVWDDSEDNTLCYVDKSGEVGRYIIYRNPIIGTSGLWFCRTQLQDSFGCIPKALFYKVIPESNETDNNTAHR